ncbi:probable glycosyltransferase STELLO2 [Coffea eugenioides]|uniref:probable glycosyltransferase STELLO2 n=1 Tax=Coffea eugenioides TaxID=49369 RepID=UPI000F60EF23|nr:probable glycosyltransferase STELLO2 [Coffea eugenioides]XP_027176688.1 probable glycosyltransferase STELLO2 [Coffea eugenioides]
MQVQDRSSAKPPKPPHQESDGQLLPTSAKFSNPTKNLDFSTRVCENLYRIIILFILVTTVAALFFLRNGAYGSDTSALLCIQSTQSHAIHPQLPQIRWNSIPPIADKSSAFANFRSEKWIVVSVSDYPSDSLRKLGKIKGWQLLAVGNSNTPKDWALKGTIYLSLEMQAQLGFRVVDYLPYDSYVRKSVGYLFAIQHGAKKIFDVDDRGEVMDDDIGKHFDVELIGEEAKQEVILQYSHENLNRTVVNPYVHFGQRSVWPRGLPLENVGEIGHEEYYTEVFGGRQFIQQGISNGLPDVDSVFYFTRKTGLEAFDIRFDEHAPKVALPQGMMVPVNSFNTIFHSSAFWALMLPVSVSSMASDVLRGYWAQRLLWEIGGYVVVYPPTIHRYDRIEAYPFSEEKDLHVNVGRLIKFLVSWRSDKHNLFEKVLQLSYVMAEEGFWTEKDVKFTAAWLQDLLAAGYQQPRLMSHELDRPRANIGHGDRKEFVPHKLPSVHLGVEEIGTVNYEIGNLIRWRKNFGNTVLIMFCSGPVERTALEWRLLYGRIFKTVIILSERKNVDLAVEQGQLDHIYKYLPKLFERYSSTDGFLFLQDDTILNYWNLLQADKTKLWITNKVSKSWTTVSATGDNDWFAKQADMVKKVVANMPVHLQVNYKESVKSEQSLTICNSELFYVPHHFVADFVDLVNLVGDLDIHHKVAIPMFFMAMDSQQNFDPVFDTMKYQQKPPSNLTMLYSSEVAAVHPWTISSEQEFIKLIRIMAAGDPLLMELV